MSQKIVGASASSKRPSEQRRCGASQNDRRARRGARAGTSIAGADASWRKNRLKPADVARCALRVGRRPRGDGRRCLLAAARPVGLWRPLERMRSTVSVSATSLGETRFPSLVGGWLVVCSRPPSGALPERLLARPDAGMAPRDDDEQAQQARKNQRQQRCPRCSSPSFFTGNRLVGSRARVRDSWAHPHHRSRLAHRPRSGTGLRCRLVGWSP